jgi:hypothetical protein
LAAAVDVVDAADALVATLAPSINSPDAIHAERMTFILFATSGTDKT